MRIGRIVARREGLQHTVRIERKLVVLARGDWKQDAMRGVADAGRRSKTQVQRVVAKQMALKPGNYQSYVVAGTRGVSVAPKLSYEIFGVPGGQRIEIYKALRVLKAGGRRANQLNGGRAPEDQGTVSSGVWNAPRIFKRSFEMKGGFFAFLPPGSGGSGRAPKALWTFGLKPNQPRDAAGRFGKSGNRYGRIRRLAGPSLRKEIPKGPSLATFFRVAPVLLEQKVGRRMSKYLDF